MIEIIRIPSLYNTQIKFLNEKDTSYVFKTIFGLASGENIKIENSIRGGLVISILRETIQMENKARAKKKKKRLEIDLATLMSDTVDTLGSSKSATKESNITSSKVKEKKVNKDIIINNNTEQSSEVIEYGDKEINEMKTIIKETIENNGMIYKSGKYERSRIKNIIEGKEFGEVCKKSNMTRKDFVINIINLASKLQYCKSINNAVDLYSNYADVYNKALKTKQEILQPKRLIG